MNQVSIGVIDKLEEALKSSDYQLDLPTRHSFSDGIYARTILIPAGTCLTGKIHKTKHLCIVSGDIEIRSEFGGGRFTGYHTFESMHGVKRAGFAYDDTYFTTIHRIETTNVEEAERLLVCDTMEQYLLECES